MSVNISKMCLKEMTVTPDPYQLIASKYFTFEIRGKGNEKNRDQTTMSLSVVVFTIGSLEGDEPCTS
jgi:hypothetical protein